MRAALLAASSASGSPRRAGAVAIAALLTAAALHAPARAQTPDPDSLRVLFEHSRFAEAEQGARAILAESQGRTRDDSIRVGQALELLAQAVRVGRRNLAEARQLADRAVAFNQALHGPEHPEVARSLLARSWVLENSGDFAAARLEAERALAINEKTLGPDHPDVARSLATLGAVLGGIPGTDSLAIALYERALAILERSLGPEHRRVGQLLHSLGMVHKRTGDYPAAKRDYERALDIRTKVHGENHPDVAWTLNNYANVLYELGDFAAVKRLHERTLAIREKVLGPEHPDVAYSLVNLGNVLVELGETAPARPLYERALAIQQKALGPNHRDVGWTLNNLAPVVAELGDRDSARALYERSVAVREKVFGPDHPEVARSLSRLALFESGGGDDSAAVPLHERVVAMRERANGPDHPETGIALAHLSLALARLGDDRRALEAALRAEDIAIRHFRLTARALEERAALQFSDYRFTASGVPLTLAARRADRFPSVIAQAWDVVIRSRAMVLDELAARNRAVIEAGSPELETLAARVAAAREQLAGLVVPGPSARDSGEYRRALEAARQGRDRAERALAEKSDRFRNLQAREQAGLEQVRGSLPEGNALVSFTRYERIETWPEARRAGRDTTEVVFCYLAFVLRAGESAAVAVDLGPVDSLDALVERWLVEARRPPAGARRAQAERACRAAGMALRARVWDPLAPHLAGAKRLLIVPDGALCLVNLGALPGSGDRYMVEEAPPLHLLSAERDVVGLETPRERGKGLLAFGAPAFDHASALAVPSPGRKSSRGAPSPASEAGTLAESYSAAGPDPFEDAASFRGPHSNCADFQSLRFVALPASLREVEEIRALWAKATGAAPAGERAVEHRIGTRASEAAFKQLAPGRQVLHLATHGFFLGADCPPAESANGVKGGHSGASSAAAEAARESPLLRAGLALAGANLRGSAGVNREDGILTAEEIAALDLAGIEWAVLSACETGLGELRAGEGVLGLQRAFRVAGAGTTVMSLWAVDDESTRGWMTALYGARLGRRLDTVSAVRAADLEVLRVRRDRGRSTHPFYWAAFVATGDWR